MIKKNILVPLAALSILFSSNAQSQAMDPNTQMACEAVLCLATGTRPNECTPSIQKYFSITAKKFKDTLKARKNFLKLCPNTDDSQVNQILAAHPPAADEPDPPAADPSSPSGPLNGAAATGLDSTATRAQLEAAIAALTPIWNAQTTLSTAARDVVEACVLVNGRVQDGNCQVEMADYNSKRLPAIDSREEIYRLQALLALL